MTSVKSIYTLVVITSEIEILIDNCKFVVYTEKVIIKVSKTKNINQHVIIVKWSS